MMLKKLLIVILGSFIMGIGISLTIAVNLGSDPMTMFWIGVSKMLHISVGQANLLVCAILLVYVFFANRKHIHVGSILNPIVIALVTDNMTFLSFQDYSYSIRIIIMIIGLIILAFGIAFYALADYGKGAYEAVVFTLSEKRNLSIGVVRTSADILLAILGVLLGATFAIGSLLAIIFMGTSIQLCIKFLQSLSNKQKVKV